MVTYCSYKAFRWCGLQEFAIPDNVLEIVYGQTICWIGTFYCPLLPAIAAVKYFVVFYIKKVPGLFNADCRLSVSVTTVLIVSILHRTCKGRSCRPTIFALVQIPYLFLFSQVQRGWSLRPSAC